MNPDGGMTMLRFIFWGVVIYVVIAALVAWKLGKHIGGLK